MYMMYPQYNAIVVATPFMRAGNSAGGLENYH